MIEIKRGGEKLCDVRVANTFFSRFRGLMFKKELPDGEGVLIEYSPYLKSREVHGFFMRFPIDLIFIDRGKKVVEITLLKPWRIYNPKAACAWVLEVNEGFSDNHGVEKGDQLSFEL